MFAVSVTECSLPVQAPRSTNAGECSYSTVMRGGVLSSEFNRCYLIKFIVVDSMIDLCSDFILKIRSFFREASAKYTTLEPCNDDVPIKEALSQVSS